MKLVANKWICDQTPQGAHFEVPDNDALVLIEAGLAVEDATTGEPIAELPARRGYRRRDLSAEA